MDAEKLIWAELGEQAQALGRAGVPVERSLIRTGAQEALIHVQACELHEVRYWEEDRARYTLVALEGEWQVIDTLMSETLPGWRGVSYLSEERRAQVAGAAGRYTREHPEAGVLAARVVRAIALERARARGDSDTLIQRVECELAAVELTDPGERQLALELLEGRFAGSAEELRAVVGAAASEIGTGSSPTR